VEGRKSSQFSIPCMVSASRIVCHMMSRGARGKETMKGGPLPQTQKNMGVKEKEVGSRFSGKSHPGLRICHRGKMKKEHMQIGVRGNESV